MQPETDFLMVGQPITVDGTYTGDFYVGDPRQQPQRYAPRQQIVSGSNTNPPSNFDEVLKDFLKSPKMSEHTHSVEALQFQGDRLVGVCTLCEQTIHVKTFPGSLNSLRAKELLEGYAANKLAARYDSEVISIGDVAAEIKMLRTLLSFDRDEQELAIQRLSLIEQDLIATLNEM